MIGQAGKHQGFDGGLVGGGEGGEGDHKYVSLLDQLRDLIQCFKRNTWQTLSLIIA